MGYRRIFSVGGYILRDRFPAPRPTSPDPQPTRGCFLPPRRANHLWRRTTGNQLGITGARQAGNVGRRVEQAVG